MNVDEERKGDVVVLKPVGRLDNLDGPVFEEAALGVLERGDHNIVLDLSRVDYISSRGIRAFITIARRAESEQGRLALCCLQEPVDRVFRISRLDELVKIFASCPEALDSFPDDAKFGNTPDR
jgi:anti-anti-sigma factor